MLGGLVCLPNKEGIAAKARLMLRQAHVTFLGGTEEALILVHGVGGIGQVTWRSSTVGGHALETPGYPISHQSGPTT